MTKVSLETMRPLFNKLNLGRNYSLDVGGYVCKKGMHFAFQHIGNDMFGLHILFLTLRLVKRNTRTSANRFSEFVDLCQMCDSIATYGGNEDSNYLKGSLYASFSQGMKRKVFRYVNGIITERSPMNEEGYRGREIKPFNEAEAEKMLSEL